MKIRGTTSWETGALLTGPTMLSTGSLSFGPIQDANASTSRNRRSLQRNRNATPGGLRGLNHQSRVEKESSPENFFFRLRRLTATIMKIARRVVFPACCAISIAVLLLAYPTFARQPQDANSNVPRASVTGRVTVVSGEGATNSLAGVTLKLMGPSVGPAPQSTVTDAESRYEFTHLAAGTYTLEA